MTKKAPKAPSKQVLIDKEEKLLGIAEADISKRGTVIVKNKLGQTFEVSKGYYDINAHKLTVVDA